MFLAGRREALYSSIPLCLLSPSHYLMTSPSVLIGNYFAGFNAFIQTVSVESGEED